MSKKRDKEISLSEKLTSLIQTKPSTIESDDDDIATADKIAPNENDSEYSADELDVTKFHGINSRLLEEDDQKYSGKGISRKDLDTSSNFIESGVDTSKENDSYAASSESDEEIEEDNEDTESESEIRSFKTKKINKRKFKKDKNEGDNFKDIFFKVGSDIEKGRAIKNQLHIWDFLLECRMKFQKCLVVSNQLPTFSNFSKFKDRGNLLFQESVAECKKSLKHLLNSLLILQNVLLKTNEDFVNSNSNQLKQAKVSVDEEIFSDSEKEDIVESNISSVTRKFKNLNDFSAEISRRYANFQSYQNNTIQKWNDKTRIGYISNKNFSAFEQSTLKQIEHVLLDKQRLIKRTQTKRSNYHILGEQDEEPPLKKHTGVSGEEDAIETVLNIKNRSLYKEIFDDDDFYHQLLNEMVRRRASDLMDPVQLGRQWMQLQKIRNKMKKTVDTKASKGRKIRFVVHPKLVNFMMPIYNSNYNEESKTELFNSLFGKTKK